ncbi:MAG: hypothetical protein PQJ35_00680 [Sphaerochaetaceae bacterium]|nr:hypothetical protein [Sphaerochaetaceae bacterium]
MFDCNGSDRIIALQVANDILKGYGDFAHLPAEDYTVCTLQMAEIFLDWAEGADIEVLTMAVPQFFNR